MSLSLAKRLRGFFKFTTKKSTEGKAPSAGRRIARVFVLFFKGKNEPKASIRPRFWVEEVNGVFIHHSRVSISQPKLEG